MLSTKFPRAWPYRLSVAEVKALVRYRDGYRCTECGVTSKQHHKNHGYGLDVHRLVPGSKYTVKGCVALCRKCHGSQPKSPRRPGTHAVRVNDDSLHQALRRRAAKLSLELRRQVTAGEALRLILGQALADELAEEPPRPPQPQPRSKKKQPD